MRFDWLIVGAGFSGAVLAERIAQVRDERVLIVDRRDHVGGNAHDYVERTGVRVSMYGPHIFHTNAKHVWDYCSNFCDWHYYQHKVLGFIDGQLVPIPINFNSIADLFPPILAAKIEDALITNFKYGQRVSVHDLLKCEDETLKFFGDFVYRRVFLNYTRKQWDLEPDGLSPSVLARVPVVIGRDDRYFGDRYQGVPIQGYTQMFHNMLAHKKIVVALKTTFEEIANEEQFDNIIYTGPIDDLYKFELGPLPYRSLRFENRHIDVERAQQVGTINYPNDYDYTRVTEQKHFTNEISSSTTLTYEFPKAYDGAAGDEPYYPIPNDENRALYHSYERLAERDSRNILMVGRLADYQYYNMDQAVARALSVFDKRIR